MHTGRMAAVAFAAALVSSTSAGAATFNLYNTGVDGSGAVLSNGTVGDPHYTLVSVPAGSTQTLVRTSVGGFPIPPYLADDSISAWIGPNNASDFNSAAGYYDYQVTFDLTGFDAATASISGQWSSDNQGGDILLNGASTSNSNSNLVAFQSWALFTISGGFVAGVNTLDFLVYNSPFNTNGSLNTGNNPTALRVEMTGTAALAALATPLPAALPLFATGLGAMGLLGWRRKKKAAAAIAAA
jgi:hypothetical protein